MNLHRNNRRIMVASVIGILLSTYALYVELLAEARPGYKAFCDFAEGASCSRVLTSPYSKGFGLLTNNIHLEIPNCIYGILFYCAMIILATYDNRPACALQFLLAIVSSLASLYLAYLLAFVIEDFCIICVTTYMVNFAITYFVYGKGIILGILCRKCKRT